MLAFIASLVFATAAVVSIGTIVHSFRSQSGRIFGLLDEARRLATQREFAVEVVSTGRSNPAFVVPAPLRPIARRSVKVRSERPIDAPRHAAA